MLLFEELTAGEQTERNEGKVEIRKSRGKKGQERERRNRGRGGQNVGELVKVARI